MKLQHATRRGPGEFITVGDALLELDERGEVEVTEEQAAKMTQGRMWQAAGTFPVDVGTGKEQPVGRLVRTREELQALAGIVPAVVPPAPDTQTVPTPNASATGDEENLTDDPSEPEKEEAEEEEEIITVHPGMNRATLAAVAVKAGYVVTDDMTKKQILELFTEKA